MKKKEQYVDKITLYETAEQVDIMTNKRVCYFISIARHEASDWYGFKDF